MMEALGARAVVCPAVPFTSPEHYYHMAKAYAESTPGPCGHTYCCIGPGVSLFMLCDHTLLCAGAVWGNQFESSQNMEAHIRWTGPE